MYNYPGSGPYARPPPPGMGAFPGAPTGPPPGMSQAPGMGAPGMGAPGMGAPGMGAPGVPGMGAPPGTHHLDAQQGPPSRFPPNFQPPPNMPNINFNAPVIRLGTGGPAKSNTSAGGDSGRREGGMDRPGGRGLGAQDSRRGGGGDHAANPLVPPTKDEVARTIFIGGITEGAGDDEQMERILRAAGSLRRWTRATDADNKPCRFGFAEYEDPDSLSTAIDVLKDVEVPVKLRPSSAAASKSEDESEDEKEIAKSKLLVFVDDATTEYLRSYYDSRGDPNPDQQEARKNSAKQTVDGVIAELLNPSAHAANNASSAGADGDGDAKPNGETNGEEVVMIPLSVDDELADIPAEMRETVAKEIQSFRDRSVRRDIERMKREEEIEAQDRLRHGDSPSIGGGANSIPVGPRDRSVPNAPLGPKGFSGSQMPKDYQKSVSFVNGTNGWVEEEDDTDADDEELERRRKAKKGEDQEHEYLNQERRWLNRERSRTAAIEREKTRDDEDGERRNLLKEKDAKRMREFNDDDEATRKHHDYYADRSQWIRNRAVIRSREANLDDLDRASEERERAREKAQQDKARGMADDFLNRQAMEIDAKLQPQQEPQRFKLSLGAAAQKAQSQAQSKRTVADVESLLEDEEADETKTKRTLIPIQFDPAEARTMTGEERQQAALNLANEIPQDKDGLWNWSVKWDFIDETVISDQLKPFIEKKIVELLGVQEQLLVEVVESHIRKKGGPQELVEQLEGALDDDAELLVRKLWRMIIFFSESEKRGIGA